MVAIFYISLTWRWQGLLILIQD